MKALKNKNILLHTVSSGVGASLASKLWNTPGISKILNGVDFPYSVQESDNYLPYNWSLGYKSVSERVAVGYALRAYQKSCQTLEHRLQDLEFDLFHKAHLISADNLENIKDAIRVLGSIKPIGVGLTGSAQTNRIRHSKDNFYLVIVTPEEIYSYKDIDIPDKERAAQDAWVADFVEKSLLSILEGNDKFYSASPGLIISLLEYCLKLSEVQSNSDVVLVPVTANPLHHEHIKLAESVATRAGLPTAFHLSLNTSGHKPPPTGQDILRRVAMVKAANVHLGTRFLVSIGENLNYVDMLKDNVRGVAMGADAFARALDSKWYDKPVREVFQAFTANNTTLWVSPRGDYDGSSIDKLANQHFRPGTVKKLDLDDSLGVDSTSLRIARGWQSSQNRFPLTGGK